MNFLAIDTSNEYLTVIASKGGQDAVTFEPQCGMQHSVRLMGAVEETLQRARLSPEECDFFAAVVGPGSFTGIRIGISAAKGFCSALKKPSLGITSFQTLAYNAEGKLLAAVPAGRGFYYVCAFGEDKSVLRAPARVDEAELCRLAREYRVCAYGPMPVPCVLADPAKGLAAAVKGARAADFGNLCAFYLKKSQAEEEREKRGQE